MADGTMALALEALRLFKARSLGEGAGVYRRALMMADGDSVPVHRHPRLLEGSGLADAAALARWRGGVCASLSPSMRTSLSESENPETSAARHRDIRR